MHCVSARINSRRHTGVRASLSNSLIFWIGCQRSFKHDMSVFGNEKYTTTKGGNLIRCALMHIYRLTSKRTCHSLSKTGQFLSPSLSNSCAPLSKKSTENILKKEGVENRGFSFTHPPLLTPPHSCPLISSRTHGECLEALFIFCLHNAFLQALYLCQSAL